MKKITKAELAVRKVEGFDISKVYWYVDRAFCEFCVRGEEGEEGRTFYISTRNIRRALEQMDKELSNGG